MIDPKILAEQQAKNLKEAEDLRERLGVNGRTDSFRAFFDIHGRYVDLNTLPTIRRDDSKHHSCGTLVFPDIHGNPLIVLESLYYNRVIDMPPEAYAMIKKICDWLLRSPREKKLGPRCPRTGLPLFDEFDLSPTDKKELEEAFKTIKVDKTRIDSISFIGDETGDRGPNEFITFLLFKVLHKAEIPYEILFSDHGAEFLKIMDIIQHKDRTSWAELYDSKWMTFPRRSLISLIRSMERGVVSKEEIIEFFKTYYWPHFKKYSYAVFRDKSIDNPKIVLLNHAPIFLESIENSARRYRVPCKLDIPAEFVQTINAINKHVKDIGLTQFITEYIVDNDDVHNNKRKKAHPDHKSREDCPLHFDVWNKHAKPGARPFPEWLVGMLFGHTAEKYHLTETGDYLTTTGTRIFREHPKHFAIDVSPLGRSLHCTGTVINRGIACTAQIYQSPELILKLSGLPYPSASSSSSSCSSSSSSSSKPLTPASGNTTTPTPLLFGARTTGTAQLLQLLGKKTTSTLCFRKTATETKSAPPL